ncbi:MAG: GNAT family N-acetyltransferase, partial [Oscillospiraceae bacterium]|nr:GNAT family N-acetyltransferase [Oscillospiraceae bacterium]
GNGTKALLLFIDYWKKLGYSHIYTQTWSGNYPMIKLADKLGFKEVCRKKDYREVNGQKYDAVTFKLDFSK